MPDFICRSFEVADELEEVGRIQESLWALCRELGVNEEDENVITLALEEILSNVLRHGVLVGDTRGIRVVFQSGEGRFEIEISDACAEYNPLLRPAPDLTVPLAERKAGGLGVFLVNHLADEVSYARQEGRNRLRFMKRLANTSSSATFVDSRKPE